MKIKLKAANDNKKPRRASGGFRFDGESRRGGGSGFSKKEINELKGMFGLRVIKNKTADELKEEL